ncbi:hypothetical protein FRB99_000545 [Tulasnella sp. 403]|nr:hypothetical protein FRB99_000545 [Tulasnella sp. 403]
MDYPTNLWDLSVPSLPHQLAPIDDTDFLTILSKQLNPSAPINPPSTQTLAQHIQEVSPPLSEDSSPSPPIAANRGLAKGSESADRNKRDDMHKRKIQDAASDDDDDDDDRPQAKSQKESGKKSTKRKSSSNGDESRAQKRKEQNRAAQRAFRERKEKHVRDLEEQVAALEAKNNTQQSENENLRELLGRLQNENLMLKQSAFTFSFPNASTPRSQTANSAPRPTPSTSSPGDSLNKSASSPASGIGATPRDSPSTQQLGLSANNPGYTPLITFSNLSNNNSSSSNNNSTGDVSMNATSPPLTFFSPPPTVPVPSPYTTIASNPMYTSYTDFSAWDQFFADTALDQTLAGVTAPSTQNASSNSNANSISGAQSGRMEDLFNTTANFSELIPFDSFSPGNSPTVNLGSMSAASNSPVAHTTSNASGMNTSNSSFTLASRETAGPSTTILQPRSSSPCGGADPDEAPIPGSAHHNPSFTSNMNVGGSSFSNATHSKERCPTSTEEFAKMIKGQPLATLGTVPGTSVTEEEKKNMRLKEVWETIKSHPEFEECDMDELCRELSSKVRCDGSMPVMDAKEGMQPSCPEIKKFIEAVKAQKGDKAKATSNAQSPTQTNGQTATPSRVQSSQPSSSTVPSPTENRGSGNDISMTSIFGNPANNFFPFAALAQATQGQQPSQSFLTSNNSGSASSGSGVSSGIPTPASAPGQAMAMDLSGSLMTAQGTGSQNQTQGLMDPWLSLQMDMPSPTTQFLSYLNSSNLGGFSPNSYINFGDKE